jgi:hypothetical protein
MRIACKFRRECATTEGWVGIVLILEREGFRPDYRLGLKNLQARYSLDAPAGMSKI